MYIIYYVIYDFKYCTALFWQKEASDKSGIFFCKRAKCVCHFHALTSIDHVDYHNVFPYISLSRMSVYA